MYMYVYYILYITYFYLVTFNFMITVIILIINLRSTKSRNKYKSFHS